MSEFSGIGFTDFQADFLKLRAQEQDLKSALYAVHPFIPAGESEPTHYIVLFAELGIGEVEYSILDSNNMELRLLSQIPKAVLILLGKLYEQIYLWVEGKAPYPHSQYDIPFAQTHEQSTVGDELAEELEEREAAARQIIEDALSQQQTDGIQGAQG